MDYISTQQSNNIFDKEHKYFLNYIERKNLNTISIDEQEFYRACFNGDFESASIILKLGINLNKRFDYGRTLLHIACIKNFYGLVKLLIKFGCNEYIKDSYSRTALHYAAMKGSDAIVRYLIERNTFNLNQINDEYYLNESIELTKQFLNLKDVHGKTALYYACEKNNLKCVEYILSNTNNLVNINAYDEINKQTALDIAYEKQYWELFELLIKHGAHINGSILREICSKGNINVVNILLRYTNDTTNSNTITNTNETTGTCSTSTSTTTTTTNQPQSNIDWTQMDENNNSPIYFAFKYSFNIDLIKRLLENNLFLNLNDINDFINDIKELKFETAAATSTTPNTNKTSQEKFSIYIEYIILLLKYGCFTQYELLYGKTTTTTNIKEILINLLDSIYSLYLRSDNQTQQKLNYRLIYMFALAIYSKQLHINDNLTKKLLINKLTQTKQNKLKQLNELFNESTKNPWSLQMLCRCKLRQNLSVKELKNVPLPYICIKYLQFEYI